MKKLFNTLALITFTLIFASCADPGTAHIKLNGSESTLPVELKGLKVYDVSVGSGNYIKVAVLDGKINSVSHDVQEGKSSHLESTILIDKESRSRLIQVEKILLENDSIIVCKK